MVLRVSRCTCAYQATFWAILTCVVILSGLSGCSTLTAGPAPAFNIDQDIAALQAHYQSATSITDYYAKGPETKDRRDEFIVGRLTLYNLQYIRYITQYSLSAAQLDSAFEITKLVTDLSITLGGTLQSKAVLGAFSGGLTGAKATIDKNFFEQKTAQALVSQMNAQRKAALVPILTGINEVVARYPLATAIVDLQAYYEAGTLLGALQGIQADAGIKDAEATKQIDQLRVSPFAADASSQKINNWIWPGVKRFDSAGDAFDASGKLITANATNVAKLKKWLADNKLSGLPIATFLNSKDLAAARQRAVKELSIQ